MAPRRRDPLAPRAAPRPVREDSRLIVDAIVQAMIELDDPEVSMSAVAARAGVGEASLYRYFPTRGTIFSELSRRLHQRFHLQVREAIATDEPLDVIVRRICEASVLGTGVGLALRRALNVAIPGAWNAEVARSNYAAIIGDVAGWLRASTEHAPADLEERVFLAFAALRGMMLQSMLLPDLAPPPARLIDRMTRTALSIVFDADEVRSESTVR